MTFSWIEQVAAHSAHQALGLFSAAADLLRATEFAHEREQRDRAQVEYSRKLWPESGEHAFEPVAVVLELLLEELENAQSRREIPLMIRRKRPRFAGTVEMQLGDDRCRLGVMEAGNPIVDLGRVVGVLRIHSVDRHIRAEQSRPQRVAVSSARLENDLDLAPPATSSRSTSTNRGDSFGCSTGLFPDVDRGEAFTWSCPSNADTIGTR